LKPTGIERPEASSRWTWLSVVRAPIAPQEIRSAKNCGVIGSRNFGARRQAELGHAEQEAARAVEALADREASIEMRIVDQALPADGRPRLLEVDAHHASMVMKPSLSASSPGRDWP
jgi:hypothetical protein